MFKRELFALQDLKYKQFHAKLVPTLSPDTMIGVRTPALRSLAKTLKSNSETGTFLNTLPHDYYEENNLHAFFIAQIQDFDKCLAEVNRFLPYVDNWATCDGLRPKCFKKNKDKLLVAIKNWISSSEVYTIRFGIEMLMVHFLEEDFDAKYLEMVTKIKSDEYYINMMIAWYFATALAKQWEPTIPYIENYSLPTWVHNKTIQKAIESYRITDGQKAYLKNFRK